jgi:tRNA pseudouridine38-40 synthase
VSAEESPPTSSSERTFRLVLEYDGGGFEGWQIQAGYREARTIQGVLAEALEGITSTTPRVRGAGRTDAGVHAWGQVASVRLSTQLEADALWRALNARLPRDLAVVGCAEVPAGWDALREARGKHYRYQIWNGRGRSPLRAARWHWVRDALSVEAMREASRCFVGTHDFASMKAAGSSAKTSVRTVTSLRISGETGGEIVLDVEGEGFLRHMVRNLAGTLIEIGRERWEVARAAEILASLDRGQAGPTAPAVGLVLMEVRDGWEESVGSDSRREPVSVDEGRPVG